MGQQADFLIHKGSHVLFILHWQILFGSKDNYMVINRKTLGIMSECQRMNVKLYGKLRFTASFWGRFFDGLWLSLTKDECQIIWLNLRIWLWFQFSIYLYSIEILIYMKVSLNDATRLVIYIGGQWETDGGLIWVFIYVQGSGKYSDQCEIMDGVLNSACAGFLIKIKIPGMIMGWLMEVSWIQAIIDISNGFRDQGLKIQGCQHNVCHRLFQAVFIIRVSVVLPLFSQYMGSKWHVWVVFMMFVIDKLVLALVIQCEYESFLWFRGCNVAF
ncbi:unnamed protein product, partial [Eruca vesicaria subsp. sativa]|nr:unnamed protein product [Eruca vesicaria subsp. sativa]